MIASVPDLCILLKSRVCRSEKRIFVVTGKIKRTFVFEDLFEGPLNQIKKLFKPLKLTCFKASQM